jgi:hypothetical protein
MDSSPVVVGRCISDRHDSSQKCITVRSEATEHAVPCTSSAPSLLPEALWRTFSNGCQIPKEAALQRSFPPVFQDAPPCSHSDAETTIWHTTSLFKVGTCVPTERRASGTGILNAAMANVHARFLSHDLCRVPVYVSEHLIGFCKRYGMHVMASTGWAMMSRQPEACAILSIGTLSSSAILSFITYFVGLLRSSWQPYLGVVAAVSNSSKFVGTAVFYIYGPLFARSKLFAFFTTVWLLPEIFLSALGFVGGQNTVPFQNRLVHACLLGLSMWLNNISGMLGASRDDHPLQPYSSFRCALISATVRTLHLMDAFTDMALVRMILAQVLCQQRFGGCVVPMDIAMLRFNVRKQCERYFPHGKHLYFEATRVCHQHIHCRLCDYHANYTKTTRVLHNHAF